MTFDEWMEQNEEVDDTSVEIDDDLDFILRTVWHAAKKHGDSPGSGVAESYEARWQNEHPKPKNEGWWWYWHPDIPEPFPVCAVFSRDPDDYGWRYRPKKYPAEDGEKEWWKPMPYGSEGPELPSAA